MSRALRPSFRTACAVLLLATVSLAPRAARAQVPCEVAPPVPVPGAACQVTAWLPDLLTRSLAATGHTDPAGYAGLHSPQSLNPTTPVPGLQVDGYFPDTSTTNTYRGWNHDAQFVLRLPDDWNGKLVVTGAPGTRRQYSLDYLISDWVLSRGYAFASTDKGNGGGAFYADGQTPGDAIAEWHARVRELTVAAQAAVRAHYGRAPERTYMTGISNGGYLTRYQLENYPELYDGGVDWEGTLFVADGPHLLTYLPTALTSYPAWVAGGRQPGTPAHQAMLDAGFAPGSEFLWDFHYSVYWDLTQRIYREELDPSFDGALQAGVPFCAPGTPSCDADYDYPARRAVQDPLTGVSVEQAVDKVSLTGKIRRPMLTLHGTLDTLLPISTDSDVYARMIRKAGREHWHRYYVIEDGNHVDGLYDLFPERLRPMLPCFRAAFVELERWVETRGAYTPPASRTIARPGSGDVANTCPLE